MSLSIGGKVVLITGTSSGFGRDLVGNLLQRGHTVIATMRGSIERFESIFQLELTRYKDRLHFFELHVDRSDTFESLKAFVEQKLQNRLDVLINNAGYGLLGPIEDMTEAQMRRQMEVNFMGPVLLTQTLLPLLKLNKGRVINISSICGLTTLPYYGLYCASKQALEAYTEALHFDLKSAGVQVALVEPGGFRTNFTSSSLVFSEKSQSPTSSYYSDAQAFERMRRRYGEKLPHPAPVIQTITLLCERPQISLRNIVGIDATLLSFFRRICPDALRISIQEWFFRKILWWG